MIKEGDHIILKGKRNKYGVIPAKKAYNDSTKSIVEGGSQGHSGWFAFFGFIAILFGIIITISGGGGLGLL